MKKGSRMQHMDILKELQDELRAISSIAGWLSDNIGETGRQLDYEEEKVLNMAKMRIAARMIDQMQFAMFKSEPERAADIALEIAEYINAN